MLFENSERHFASKLLLFGEYSIIHGSAALAIPVASFSGKLESGNYNWNGFKNYLHNLDLKEDGLFLDEEKLNRVNQFVFNSNIPTGYGLGSSAALTAAFFDTFFIKDQKLTLTQLRGILADIESYFHGTSSGIDPLVSYLNQPIHILEGGAIEIIDWRSEDCGLQFYIYDSCLARDTKTLVQAHKKRFEEDVKYRNEITNLIRYNNAAISALLAQNDQDLISAFYMISMQERQTFNTMIPDKIRADYDKLALKFCGAGGGGFFLGLAARDKTAALVSKYPITLI